MSKILYAPVGLSLGLGLGFGNFVAPKTMRPVTNRCYQPSVKTSAGAPNWAAQLNVKFMSAAAGVKLYFPNYFSSNETATGGTLTVTASLEWGGVRTQILFSGSATGTVASGGTLISDAIGSTVPAGTAIFRAHFNNPSGVPYTGPSTNVLMNTGAGEGVQQTATDFTMSGNLTDDQAGRVHMGPCGIFGLSSAPALLIVGDSRVDGLWDTVDTNGQRGNFARSFPNTAHLSIAASGDTSASFLIHNTQRMKLVQGITHVMSNYGINSFRTSVSAASVGADHGSIRTLIRGVCPAAKYAASTVGPDTTGAWTAVDGSDQTINATSNPIRQTYNTNMLANAYGLDAVFDDAVYAESIANPGKWKSNGTVQKYTFDGLHDQAFSAALRSYSIASIFGS